MQPNQPMLPVPSQTKVSAFRIGLRFGIILAVILIALDVAGQALTGNTGVSLAFSAIGVIAALVAYFFAGFRASSRSGKVSTGLLAGMWAGIIGSLVKAVAGILLAIPRLPGATAQANQFITDSGAHTSIRYTETALLLATIGVYIVLVIISGAVALGVGALGGAAGKGRAPLPPQLYQESMYQPPMAGYSPQPGDYPPEAGGYPPHR